MGALTAVFTGSDIAQKQLLGQLGSVSGSGPSTAFLHSQSLFLLGTGLAVREVTSPSLSTPLLD